MTNENIDKFHRKLNARYYWNTYEILILAFEENPKDESLPTLSEELLILIRTKAMDLAYNKATEMSREAGEADVLHRLVKLFISKL